MILVFVNELDTGGAQTLIELLALERSPEVNIHLVVLGHPGALSDRIEAVVNSTEYFGFARSSWNLPLLVWRTHRVIRRRRPNVVHSHLLQADLAVALTPRARGVHYMSTVHTTGFGTGDSRRTRVLARAMGLLSQRFDDIVAVSTGAQDYMRSRGYPMPRCTVIVNDVQVSAGSAAAAPRIPGRLLSLARWHPMKDYPGVFDALVRVRQELPEVHLVCAGTAMEQTNDCLVAEISARGLQNSITLLGPVSDVRKLLRESQALVIGSAYGEAMPMAGLESLAEATPVITTLTGSCGELAVDPALAVAPGNSELLSVAITAFLRLSEGQRMQLRERADELSRAVRADGGASAAYDRLYHRSGTHHRSTTVTECR